MLLMNTLKYVSVPCVIDADGLNLSGVPQSNALV